MHIIFALKNPNSNFFMILSVLSFSLIISTFTKASHTNINIREFRMRLLTYQCEVSNNNQISIECIFQVTFNNTKINSLKYIILFYSFLIVRK